MRIDDATPEDIRFVAQNMRERDLIEFSAVYPVDGRGEIADMLVERLSGRGAICASNKGRPVCIGVVIETRPNTVALGFFATEAFPEVALGVTKFIRNRLFPRYIEAGVHRIECASLEGYEQVHRWLETLGLKREFDEPMRNFGKRGEAFAQFSWVKE